MENKKTFAELSTNDILYRIKKTGSLLDSNDNYGNKYNSDLILENKITNLKLTDTHLYVNEGNRYDLLKLNISQINLMSVSDEDYIFFVNKEDYYKHIRNFIKNKIFETEKSIVDYKTTQEKYICNLREKYFDFLNNN